MATRLKAALKRELDIDGDAYMLTVTPAGLKLTRKGRRKGHELAWRDFIRGEAALAVALNASLKQSVERTPRAGAPAAAVPARSSRKPAGDAEPGKRPNKSSPRRRGSRTQ